MGNSSTIDVFATNDEMLRIAREFAENHELWITVIRFPDLIVLGRSWVDVESHTRQPVELHDCLDILLTADEPDLAGVRQTAEFFKHGAFKECIEFHIGHAGGDFVLETRIGAWYSEESRLKREVNAFVRMIRKNTMTGFWAFTADLEYREFYRALKRYTYGAKALQDAGAKIGKVEGPSYVLGEECPYPLSKAKIVERKSRRGGRR